jgi:phenylalanyl-tRNA synthetase beta subunit
VDATILAGLEFGQPTHVFDAARGVGPVTVRLSHAGERAWPLFAAGHVDIPAGTLILTGGITAAVHVAAGDSIVVQYQSLGSIRIKFI